MRENREASIKSKKRDLDVKIQFNSIFLAKVFVM